MRFYFLVTGPALAVIGLGVLIDFHGLGKQFEEGMNRNSAYINKVARLPWPPNPSLGPVYRPWAGGFGIVLGLALAVAALSGAIR
jgi:hypothetical protein